MTHEDRSRPATRQPGAGTRPDPPPLSQPPPERHLGDEVRLTNLPVAMLPVRIETRFAGGGSILRIRIFPDDVAVDSHERPLTGDERTAATDYHADPSPQRWRDLVARFGAGRAEWLAHAPLGGPGDPGTRTATWTRAPHTRVLPSRWYAFGYRGGQRVFAAAGRPVADQLAVGPDPSADAVGGDAAPVDAGMRWLVDFTAALDAGMAIEVPLAAAARGRLDRLVVLGVRQAVTSGADDLRDLLNAQRYTGGLGFLADDTPTNHTRDERAPFDPSAPPPQTPPGPPAYHPRDGSNRDRTARALGIDEATLAGIPGADTGAAEEAGRRAMGTALWPATLGYYLDQLLAPAVSAAAITAVREHFVGWVRGGGPLPVLRVGDQPYGLLVATPLDRWQPYAGDAPPGLVDLIRRGVGIWRDSLPEVPRVGRPGTTDESRNLLATLAVQPRSIAYRARSVLGADYVGAAWRFLRQQLPATWWQAEAGAARQMLDRLGVTAQPRLTTSTFAADDFPLSSPPVTAAQPPDETSALDPNYLAWLSGAARPGYRALRDETYPGAAALPVPRPLLYLLARHSMLRAYLQAARAMAPAPLSASGREDELIGIDEIDDDLAAPRPPTPWDELAQDAKGRRLDTSTTGPVQEVRAALSTLATLPVRTLERLFAETVDVCSYRLDAWATSIALRRLDAVRAAQPTGLHLGGWGAVLDLEPDAAPRESRGFIHAPSPGHATAAAILASGYLTHQPVDGRHPLAVDLSSARVHAALGLLDGVRRGATLGALLGQRFERELHERALDRYIDDFRRFTPLRETTTPAGGRDPLATRTVVDGLALLRRWVAAGRRSDGTGWPGGPAARPAIDAVLAALDETIDAVADVLLAEGVFQAARGDQARAAAALDAAAGTAPPPAELEMVQPPRSGLTITHRLLAVLPGDARPGPEWAGERGQMTPRTVAEPRLAALAARFLPAPHRAVAAVEYGDPVTGQALATRTLRLDEVEPRMGPLDVVYAADPPDVVPESEIVERIRYYAMRTRPRGVPAGAQVRLAPAAGDRAAGDVPLPELLEVARAVRAALVGGARALATADLCAPESPAGDTTDLAELQARADSTLRLARDTADRLARAGAGPAETTRAALLAAAGLGVPGAVPVCADGDTDTDRTALAGQADRVLDELHRRLSAADRLPPAGIGSPHQRDRALAILSVVLGPGFQVLPLLSPPSPSDPLHLDAGFPHDAALTGGDPQAAAAWVDRVARVRPAVQRLHDAALYTEALTGDDVLHPAVGQLPVQPGDRWIGLPFDTAHAPPAGRLSCIAARPLGAATRSLTGLVVDEWTESIPAAETTTAVALHFDRPNATAPQAVLLAVPPRQDGWTLADLEATVTQTLDLAQARMVDPDALRGAGHLLPAIHLAANLRGSTIATDLKRGRGWRVT